AEVVVEEYLTGEEASFFCLCDGATALPFGTAQDHKRVGDGDTGPNTGGMGAYSPAPVMTPEMTERTMREIIEPTMRGMANLGAPFAGILFAGLMITDQGPKLIEYNTRFGDPECQVLMMRLKDDLLVLLNAAVDGQLAHMSVRWSDDAALTVV
ncbi:MAG: phosphoribosylamine--glycine ligase, partial [Mesorhizobium sp.]